MTLTPEQLEEIRRKSLERDQEMVEKRRRLAAEERALNSFILSLLRLDLMAVDGIENPEPEDTRAQEWLKRQIDELSHPRCDSYVRHGPGHQSVTFCQFKGSHEDHYATWGNGEAEWTGPSYTADVWDWFWR